jgi:hypothetical protein
MQLERAAVNLEALSAAQQRAPRLAHAMAGYLAWLAPQMPTLRGLLVETFTGARARATADGEHLRVPEALAHLWIGVHSALTYAQEIGACSVEEAENIREECWAALLGLGRQHGGLVEEERPSRRFLRVLLTLHTQRRGHLADRYEPDDRPPPGAELLGWVDAEALYLLPEAAYEAVARFCHQTGEPFPIREERLTRDLKIDGLSECDPKRLTRTVAIGGRTRRVLKLHRAAVETLTGEAIAVSSPDLTGLTGLGE